MIQPNSTGSFTFSDQIDSNFLYSLYEDDYQYIEEIFGTTLQHFDGDFNAIKDAYAAGDLEAVRKAVHKIKPTFGFVGLPAVQQNCKEFEDFCQNAASTIELKQQYQQIVATLAVSKELIEAEHNKLKAYNGNL
jgi:HPt (histidine-containing phosphotransfer) domain-containing protein